MRLRSLLITLALAIGAFVPATATAASAEATACQTVWLTSPTYSGNIQAGTERCIWPNDKTDAGWVRLYQFDTRTRPVVDLVNPYNYTLVKPNNGLYQTNADRVRALADKYDVRLQFAVKDLRGRVGCQGDNINQITGTYGPSYRHPGRGLVRLGTGTTSTCMQNWHQVHELTLHELAHARIEYRCGTWMPGMSEYAAERTTDAYAYRYMGAWTKDPGGYGFGDWHWNKAEKIANRDC